MADVGGTEYGPCEIFFQVALEQEEEKDRKGRWIPRRVPYPDQDVRPPRSKGPHAFDEQFLMVHLMKLLGKLGGMIRRCTHCSKIFLQFRRHAEFCSRGCQSIHFVQDKRRKNKEDGAPGAQKKTSVEKRKKIVKHRLTRRIAMARPGGKDRGITQRKGREGWWVRIFHNGRERWHKCDTKSQAKALYGRLKAEAREGKYFPARFNKPKDVTLQAWIKRYLETSTNRGIGNEKRYGRRWSLYLGKRLLADITTEELRRIQSRMRARRTEMPKGKRAKKGMWSDATINRHFAFIRHVLNLAVKDELIGRNPSTGIPLFPEAHRTRFLTHEELVRLKNLMGPE